MSVTAGICLVTKPCINVPDCTGDVWCRGEGLGCFSTGNCREDTGLRVRAAGSWKCIRTEGRYVKVVVFQTPGLPTAMIRFYSRRPSHQIGFSRSKGGWGNRGFGKKTKKESKSLPDTKELFAFCFGGVTGRTRRDSTHRCSPLKLSREMAPPLLATEMLLELLGHLLP